MCVRLYNCTSAQRPWHVAGAYLTTVCTLGLAIKTLDFGNHLSAIPIAAIYVVYNVHMSVSGEIVHV